MRDVTRFPSGTVSFSEPGLGSDFGLPDAWVANAPAWTPVELKRGPSVVKELRPTQRLWHRNSLSLGIQTYGMTLRSDGTVALVALRLSGGFMSELLEDALGEVDLPSLDLPWIINKIT